MEETNKRSSLLLVTYVSADHVMPKKTRVETSAWVDTCVLHTYEHLSDEWATRKYLPIEINTTLIWLINLATSEH